MKEYIQPIKEQVSVTAACERYGIKVDTRGFAHCPFHSGDHTASMKISDRRFHCFGCGKDGDVIKFVQSIYDITFSEAMNKINFDFCLNLPIGRKATLREQQNYAKAYREFKARRNSEIARQQEIEQKRTRLLDEWCFCDRAKRCAAPESGAYEQACKRIDYVSYLLDELEIEEAIERCHQNTKKMNIT